MTKKIELKEHTIHFSEPEENTREVRLAKSQTRVDDSRQVRMLSLAPEEFFTPMQVEVEADAFVLSFHIDPYKMQWEDIRKLHRHEKLQLLLNLFALKKQLNGRITFFLHPDNLIFDDSLRPFEIV